LRPDVALLGDAADFKDFIKTGSIRLANGSFYLSALGNRYGGQYYDNYF
jgi:hypothetical protein